MGQGQGRTGGARLAGDGAGTEA
eukprot:COSAG06_NODE_25273_length_641_cov_0.680812_1_plen_22_part_10